MLGMNRDAWFVKASFGIEWGPISASTLLEMAESGALARDDLARDDLHADWRPIQTVIDELRLPMSASTDEPLKEEAHGGEELAMVDSSASQPDSELDQQPTSTTTIPTLARGSRRGALPGWSNYWTPDSVTSPQISPTAFQFQSAPETPSENFADDQEEQGKSEFEMAEPQPDHNHEPEVNDQEPATTNDQFALLESWKRDRTERLNRLLKIVADRETAEKRTDENARVATPVTETTSTPQVDDGTMGLVVEPTPLAQLQQRVVKAESWDQSLARWKRSLPDKYVLAALLLVFFSAWSFWPESYGDISETYRAMYERLEHLRELENNKTGMDEFVQASQATLAKMIPVLEKRATPNRPESQWLLWMGRDCLSPLLKNPRLRDTKPEVTFRKLMAEWDRKYNPSVLTSNAPSNPKSEGHDSEGRESEDHDLLRETTTRSRNRD